MLIVLRAKFYGFSLVLARVFAVGMKKTCFMTFTHLFYSMVVHSELHENCHCYQTKLAPNSGNTKSVMENIHDDVHSVGICDLRITLRSDTSSCIGNNNNLPGDSKFGEV